MVKKPKIDASIAVKIPHPVILVVLSPDVTFGENESMEIGRVFKNATFVIVKNQEEAAKKLRSSHINYVIAWSKLKDGNGADFTMSSVKYGIPSVLVDNNLVSDQVYIARFTRLGGVIINSEGWLDSAIDGLKLSISIIEGPAVEMRKAQRTQIEYVEKSQLL